MFPVNARSVFCWLPCDGFGSRRALRALAFGGFGLEAALARRIFDGFVDTESGTKLVAMLRAEGHLTKRGRAFTKSDVYRVLSNRTDLGEAMLKGKSHPGAHAAIVPQAIWNAAHALLTISPRTRANRTRCQTPSLRPAEVTRAAA